MNFIKKFLFSLIVFTALNSADVDIDLAQTRTWADFYKNETQNYRKYFLEIAKIESEPRLELAQQKLEKLIDKHVNHLLECYSIEETKELDETIQSKGNNYYYLKALEDLKLDISMPSLYPQFIHFKKCHKDYILAFIDFLVSRLKK